MNQIIFITFILMSTLVFAQTNDNHGAAHLVFSSGTLNAHTKWMVGPQVGKESVLRIEWKKGLDHTATEPNGSFDVTIWMPSMNHGSAPTQIQRVLDANGEVLTGVYDIYSVYFMMGGDWQVRVTLKNPIAGSSETKFFNLKLAGDDHGH